MVYNLFKGHSKLFASTEFFLRKDECEQIIEIGLSEILSTVVEKGKVGGTKSKSTLDESIRKSNVSFIKSDVPENQWLYDRISNKVIQTNNEYWNFDLDWFRNFQFTIYSGDYEGYYKKHVDMIEMTPRMRKLTFSIQLSDPADYTGGDLICYTSDTPHIMSKNQGTINFFPSWVIHEVTPITSGTRYSLVGWAEGPKFK